MSHSRTITRADIGTIKRRAKQLSRLNTGKSYMQHLDVLARDMFGVRHYHEARKVAERGQTTVSPAPKVVSPLVLYFHACQDAYFEI